MTRTTRFEGDLHLFAEPPDLPPLPTVPAGALPWLTIEQMAKADALATGPFGIAAVQMLEHAGAALADVVMRTAPYGIVSVLAGAGNNGAAGLCSARHLIDRGREVEVVLAATHLGPAATRQLHTLAAMGVEPVDRPLGEVAVDAMAGFGSAPFDETAARLAGWTAGERVTVSLDAPSGLGHPGAVRPDVTVTLALPKADLADVRPLYLADIGIPPQLWSLLGFEVGPVFRAGPVVEVV